MENFDFRRPEIALLLPLFFALTTACSDPDGANSPSGTGAAAAGVGGTGASAGGWLGAGGTSAGGTSSGGQAAGSGGAAAATGGATNTGGDLGAASGGSTGTGGSFRDNYPQGANWTATSYRIGAACGNSICHNGGELFSLMVDEHLPETLLNHTVKQCGGVPIVDPGNPEGSALIMLTTRQCGDFVMPDGCGTDICLPDYWIPELMEWIRSGASMEASE